MPMQTQRRSTGIALPITNFGAIIEPKQTTKTSTALQTKRTKEHRTTEEEMGGPTSPGGLTL